MNVEPSAEAAGVTMKLVQANEATAGNAARAAEARRIRFDIQMKVC